MPFAHSIPFARLRRALDGPLRTVTRDRRTAADCRLASRIADLFDQVPLTDAESVSAYVRNESVVLTGVVYSAAEQDMVVELVRRVPGVDRVVSRIKVMSRSDASPKAPPRESAGA